MSNLIEIQYPVLDHFAKVANISINKTIVSIEKEFVIDNLSLINTSECFLIVDNENNSSVLTLNNKIQIELTNGVSAIRIESLYKLQDFEEDLSIKFSDNFKGYFYVIGKFEVRE